jgi:hypothetical protein
MFYAMSNRVLFFLSPFSFSSAKPNWGFETSMLSDRWPSAFRNLWHPHSWSWLWRNHRLTAHSKSVTRSDFFQTLGIYSTRFLCWNCPLGFSFQSIYLREYFKLVKYPACVITIRSILKMMITSVFSDVSREPSHHGIRNQVVLRRCGIYSTRFFLRVWSISNWMLSLEYWKLGHVSSTKTTL